jgi:hypothetical protein
MIKAHGLADAGEAIGLNVSASWIYQFKYRHGIASEDERVLVETSAEKHKAKKSKTNDGAVEAAGSLPPTAPQLGSTQPNIHDLEDTVRAMEVAFDDVNAQVEVLEKKNSAQSIPKSIL